MEDTNQQPATLDLTVDIVTAFLSKNPIGADQVPALIASVHGALNGLGQGPVEPEEVVEKPTAAQIRKSIGDEGLVSFIDGRTYKSLKRHLSTHGFTPQSYRETFGLKPDYPMVSPAYSRARSELARTMGLGARGRQPAKDASQPRAGRAKKAEAAS